MRDYRTMSPCERVRYYRACLQALDANRGEAIATLARVFEELIEENQRECHAREKKEQSFPRRS